MNDKLYKEIAGKIDELIDGGYPNQEIFDELCEFVDDKYNDTDKGVIPYVRVFWHNDSDSDLDNVCDELLDNATRWRVLSYCVVERVEMDATIFVALQKRNGDEDD